MHNTVCTRHTVAERILILLIALLAWPFGMLRARLDALREKMDRFDWGPGF